MTIVDATSRADRGRGFSVELTELTGRRQPTGGLHGYVVNELGGDIAQGRLAAGTTLNVNELCERFGVSRSVMRESLRALESLGLVLARPQVGTRVMAIQNWDLLNSQVVRWRGYGAGYRHQMLELLEMRRGVEGTAARLAATRLSDEALVQLQRVSDRLVQAGADSDGRGWVAADVAFHRLILEGSGNAVLAQFAETVAAVLHTRQHAGHRAITDATPASVKNHVDLAAALVARDPDRAEQCAIRIVDVTLREFEGLGDIPD